MKPLLGPSLILAATALFLAGCDPEGQGDQKPPKKTGPGGFATPQKRDPRPSDTTDNTTGEEPPPKEHRDRAPQGPDSTPVTPPAPKVAAGAPEYAKPVPGKPGFVTSPYKPYDGLVDVRGFAPGTELQDPYEKGRTFLVPAQ
ncbi:MAG TPA: hypothetical protein VGO11_25605 [Chthoniobacteraceae bacterium]|jgi:hypothetical protein|nr:hypothetical protein [Chthoniobacteraceae bacterium]